MTPKTLSQLREEFEDMAARCMFDLTRSEKTGEYIRSRGQTFCLWAGYWECAKKNGVIVGADADHLNMHT